MLVPKKNRLAVYSFLFKGQQTATSKQAAGSSVQCNRQACKAERSQVMSCSSVGPRYSHPCCCFVRSVLPLSTRVAFPAAAALVGPLLSLVFGAIPRLLLSLPFCCCDSFLLPRLLLLLLVYRRYCRGCDRDEEGSYDDEASSD